MRLVFAGTPAVAVPSLRALVESRHEVVGVITRPDAGAGRGRRSSESPVSVAAGELRIPILKPQRPADAEFQAQLRELAPDVCPVVAYGALLPQPVLEIPAEGWVNLHFSLLPAWRGAAPVQHAILHGDDVTGASTFRLERGMDTGPVYGTVTESIRPGDTAGDLLGRLATSGAGLLAATIDAIATGTARAEPQAGEGVSLAPKLTVEDVRVDWSTPALRIDRLVRAASPAPGAWTTFRDERLKLGSVELASGESPDLAPGELLLKRVEVLVGTGSTPVRLVAVQPAGKRMMSGADWARGSRGAVGESLR